MRRKTKAELIADLFEAVRTNPATRELPVVILTSMDLTPAQYAWLKADLAANPTSCTLAYWHHPLFSSGEHGNNTVTKPLWQLLQDNGAELVLTGHDHDYERFARQNGDGVRTRDGIIEFVVGTGGATTRPFDTRARNSVVRIADTGILRMTLNDDRTYRFTFLDAATGRVDDSGGARCHR